MRSPEQAPPESFTVGTKTFSWTPFPPVPERGKGRVRSCPVSPQHHPAREPRGTPSAEEQPSLEGTPTLRSCPMCQADFSPGLAPLDIDSHLAQCLADSTDDVVW
nr:Fanconi anemia core complex-associated protein 20 [Camelus bactrianus]